MTKKEFIIAQIAPYFQNPDICGFNEEDGRCVNLTKDGRMCVFGKNLLHPVVGDEMSSSTFFKEYGIQSDFLKPESVNKLNKQEWARLQIVHDHIAQKHQDRAIAMLNILTTDNRFEITKEELLNF